MTNFLDGPAKGVTLELRRAPLFLRVTHDAGITGDGQFDALDQLADTPKITETIYVYRLKGSAGSVHLSCRDAKTGRRYGRNEMLADYELFAPQPADEILRDATKWGEWATTQAVLQRKLNTEKPAGA